MNRRRFLKSFVKTGSSLAAATLVGANGSGPLLASPFGPPPVLAEPRVLTRDPNFSDYRPCFSPDGRVILFERTNSADFTTFYTIPVRGGNAQPFQPNGTLPMFRPDWSWTRRSYEIAFDSGSSLYLADVRTRKTSLLLQGDSNAHKIFSYPSWFCDGRSLSCTNYWDEVQADGCSNNNQTKQYLLQLDISNGSQTPLTQGVWPAPQPLGNNIWPGMSSVSHGFSPHGSRPLIAFAGERPVSTGYCQNDNQIWILKADGTVRLIDPNLSPDNQQARAPWWSPSGRLIAFESVRLGPTDLDYRIFVQSPFHPQLLFPVTPPSPWIANHAKWSPCGTKLVFAYENPQIKSTGFGLALVELSPLLRYWSNLALAMQLGWRP